MIQRNGDYTLTQGLQVNQFAFWVKHSETVASVLLLLWCLLPLAEMAYNVTMGATGRLFPGLSIAEAARTYNLGVNYLEPLGFYRKMFQVLGIVTLCYALLCAALSITRVFKRDSIRDQPWFCILLLLLSWACICSLMSDSFFRALFGEGVLYDGLFSYFVYAGVFVCAAMIHTEFQRKLILRCYAALSALLAGIMLLEEGGNEFLRACMPSQRAVVFNQFNHLGYVLCMGILAFVGLYLYDGTVHKTIKGCYLAGIALTVYALLVNDTFGCYLAVFLALPVVYLFYSLSGRKVNAFVFLPVVLFVVISLCSYLGFAHNAPALSGNMAQLGTDVKNVVEGSEEAANAGTLRFVKWMDTLERIKQRPVFGFGPEGFYGANVITEGDAPHNEYLQIAGYLGVPGLILYLSALVALAVHQWNRLRKLEPFVLASAGVTVAYLISASFGNPVYNTAPYYWMFLGMTTAVGVGEKPLICVESVRKNGSIFSTDKRRDRFVLGTVCLWAVALTAGVYLHMALENEHTRETADLLAMKNAELTAQMLNRAGKMEQGEAYWYDARTYKLTPGTEQPPMPYGMGSPMCGDSYYEFCQSSGEIYSYDESTDYTDKVIRVMGHMEEDGTLTVAMNWVKR